MDSLLALPPRDIHLWLSFYNEITDKGLLGHYRELLVAEEKEQEQRFHFSRDRHRYLVTRAMVRTVLSRYTLTDPASWLFSVGAYGRPEIANVESRSETPSFNISHTQGLIVLGVAKRRAIGVDVENVLEREVSIDIADQFFSREEVAALAQVPTHQKKYRFFEYWTFKEAYIKARGMGLSLPLDKFSFRYPQEATVDIAIHPELEDASSRWQLWQFKPNPRFLIAVCAERIGALPCSVTVRKIVPAVQDEVLNLIPTRNSR
jgi:4'-phosphopantetheinyl transferase